MGMSTRFYSGDLPARPDQVERVKAILRAQGPRSRKQLAAAARLSLNQTLCAVDALIAQGEIEYDGATRTFGMRATS